MGAEYQRSLVVPSEALNLVRDQPRLLQLHHIVAAVLVVLLEVPGGDGDIFPGHVLLFQLLCDKLLDT